MTMPASAKHAAVTVDVRVGFSCHTFTRDPEIGETTAPYLTRDYEKRHFCPRRYALSKTLPEIVRSLPARSCYYADGDNYFVIEAHELLLPGEEYRVFFNVRHGGEAGAVLVFVQSAYPADTSKGAPRGFRYQKVGFRVLVNHALRRSKPKRPP